MTPIADYLRWPRRGRGLDALAESDRAVEPPELAARRDQLSTELAELQWDLGGLTYEMARRDHFRLDVLVRQAAKLQGVDAELGEVERLLHLERAGAGGTCPACGALHARGAIYCWQCGADLMAQQPAGGETGTLAPIREDPVVQPAQAQAPAGPPMPEVHQPPPARRFAPSRPDGQPEVGGAEGAPPPPVSEPPASSARTGAAGI